MYLKSYLKIENFSFNFRLCFSILLDYFYCSFIFISVLVILVLPLHLVANAKETFLTFIYLFVFI